MDKMEHLDLYRQMVIIRRVEDAAELYQQGKLAVLHFILDRKPSALA